MYTISGILEKYFFFFLPWSFYPLILTVCQLLAFRRICHNSNIRNIRKGDFFFQRNQVEFLCVRAPWVRREGKFLTAFQSWQTADTVSHDTIRGLQWSVWVDSCCDGEVYEESFLGRVKGASEKERERSRERRREGVKVEGGGENDSGRWISTHL